MSAVTEYIDAHFEATLDRLRRWAAQPSISTENVGVEEMAALVAAELEGSGFDVKVYPTTGYPIVLATAGPADAPALLIYNHYDVQPVGELADWTTPPFEPQVLPVGRVGQQHQAGHSRFDGDGRAGIEDQQHSLGAAADVHDCPPPET